MQNNEYRISETEIKDLKKRGRRSNLAVFLCGMSLGVLFMHTGFSIYTVLLIVFCIGLCIFFKRNQDKQEGVLEWLETINDETHEKKKSRFMVNLRNDIWSGDWRWSESPNVLGYELLCCAAFSSALFLFVIVCLAFFWK